MIYDISFFTDFYIKCKTAGRHLHRRKKTKIYRNLRVMISMYCGLINALPHLINSILFIYAYRHKYL